MEVQEFKNFRKNLQKTQEEMARLLGISVKAVRSYEQGWRTIPAHAERQLLFLSSKKDEIIHPAKPCWAVRKCDESKRENCPAWEFRAGTICWFINGTICNGGVYKTWQEKIEICKKCKAFPPCLKKFMTPSTKNVSESSSEKS